MAYLHTGDYGEESGTVVISIGSTDALSLTSYFYLYRVAGQPDLIDWGGKRRNNQGQFAFFASGILKDSPDREELDRRWVILAQKLPPGDYEIYDLLAVKQVGPLNAQQDAGERISIPFRVKKGVTTYIGNYTADNWGSIPVVGHLAFPTVVYYVENREDIDISLAASKYGIRPESTVLNSAPSQESVSHCYFPSPETETWDCGVWSKGRRATKDIRSPQ